MVLSVTLEWENPASNCDGTQTTDLKEVWIYQEGVPETPLHVVDAAGQEGQVQSANVPVPDGSWNLCVAAVDFSGNRSNMCQGAGEICIAVTVNEVPPLGCTNFKAK